MLQPNAFASDPGLLERMMKSEVQALRQLDGMKFNVVCKTLRTLRDNGSKPVSWHEPVVKDATAKVKWGHLDGFEVNPETVYVEYEQGLGDAQEFKLEYARYGLDGTCLVLAVAIDRTNYNLCELYTDFPLNLTNKKTPQQIREIAQDARWKAEGEARRRKMYL